MPGQRKKSKKLLGAYVEETKLAAFKKKAKALGYENTGELLKTLVDRFLDQQK